MKKKSKGGKFIQQLGGVMKKLILLISILFFVGCNDDTQTNGDGDNNSSYSVVGEWQRIWYGQQLLEVVFHEDGVVNASAVDVGETNEMPEHTYTINDDIITLIGICNAESSEWNYVTEGTYSYIINNSNSTLTLTLINEECPDLDDGRAAFYSDESSASWTRVD